MLFLSIWLQIGARFCDTLMPPRKSTQTKREPSPPIEIEEDSEVEMMNEEDMEDLEGLEDDDEMIEDMNEEDMDEDISVEDDEEIDSAMVSGAASSEDEEETTPAIMMSFGKKVVSSKLDALMSIAKKLPLAKVGNNPSDSDSDSNSDSDSDMEEVSTSSAKQNAMKRQRDEEERKKQAELAKEEALSLKRKAIEDARLKREAKKPKVAPKSTQEEESNNDEELLSLDILEEVENDDNSKFEELMRRRRMGAVDLSTAPTSRKIDTDFDVNKQPKDKKFKHGSITVQARPSAGNDRRAMLAKLAQASCNSSASSARRDMLHSKRVRREVASKSVSLNGQRTGAPLTDFAVATSYRGKALQKK